LLGCVSGAALLILAVGQASAAGYPAGGSSFSGSAEGWKATPTECKLLGLVELLCTTEGTGYDGTAGVPAGSLADRAQIPVSLVSLFKAAYINESPAFTAAASGPGQLSLSRQFVPGGLISFTPASTYTAYLVDKTTNTKQKAITESITAEAPFATRSGAVSLTAGDTYTVQIESSITATNVAGLLTETITRFDNVVVTGPNPSGNPEGPPNDNGNNGTRGDDGEGGGNGNGGAGGVSAARLEGLMQSSLTGSAVLKGKKLIVKAKCPAKLRATCTLAITGMLSKKKAATTHRRARVKKGKKKRFVLKVKPAALKKVKTKKKLLFKEQARVGKSKVIVYKRLKLVRK
jgi:hypothetical protein